MDVVFEIIGDILIEGAFEICSNENISKWIRYPILILLTIFYSLIVGAFIYLGISFLKESLFISIIMFLIATILITMISIVIIKNKKKHLN